MKRNKGFPYREKKKQKSKLPEDRRPHISVRMPLRGWVRREELEEATGDVGFYIPSLKYIEDSGRPNWTRQEAHTLIDSYANIAWKDNQEFRRNMAKLAGHFMSLFDKQKGLCALTDLPLLGAPGMKHYGIGIDLLHKKRGPVKGNIRLVSCPLAVMRYRYPQYATQSVALPNRKHYPNFDITYAIAHTIYWYIDRKVPFKNLPIRVEFPPESDQRPSSRYDTSKGMIKFLWVYADPSLSTYNDLKISQDSFFRVYLDGADLRLEGTDKIVERHIPLTDPSFDIEKEICDAVKLCFRRGLHIKFRKSSY